MYFAVFLRSLDLECFVNYISCMYVVTIFELLFYVLSYIENSDVYYSYSI